MPKFFTAVTQSRLSLATIPNATYFRLLPLRGTAPTASRFFWRQSTQNVWTAFLLRFRKCRTGRWRSVGVARQGKVGRRAHWRPFFTIFSVVSTAVGITYRSWETGRERDGGGEREGGKLVKVFMRERERCMKTCEETHELCSIIIQRFWPLRYGVLWNGGYSLPRTMRGGCRSVASFFFLGRSCAGGGGYAAILFLLFSFPPCKVVLSGWQPIR